MLFCSTLGTITVDHNTQIQICDGSFLRHETKTETKAPFKPALSINRAFPTRGGHIPPTHC